MTFTLAMKYRGVFVSVVRLQSLDEVCLPPFEPDAALTTFRLENWNRPLGPVDWHNHFLILFIGRENFNMDLRSDIPKNTKTWALFSNIKKRILQLVSPNLMTITPATSH